VRYNLRADDLCCDVRLGLLGHMPDRMIGGYYPAISTPVIWLIRG
jgi:hypothetical protein